MVKTYATNRRRLVARGLDDELKGTVYAVVDSVDGRTHHIRFADLDAASDAAPGGIVELRRFEDATGRQRTGLAVRSDLALEAQVQAGGATWLDRQLLAREPAALASGGFGREVREAMDARAEHLIGEGFARRQGQRIVFARDLLDTLRRRQLEAAGAQVASSAGLPYLPAKEGEAVAGVYRQRLNLASGRFAMIDDGLGFSLVPWSPSLERTWSPGVGDCPSRQDRLELWKSTRSRHWLTKEPHHYPRGSPAINALNMPLDGMMINLPA